MYFGENACFHCRNDGIFVEIGVKSVSERIRKMKKGVYEFNRQKLIIQMRLDNKTQKQIAARLNITQQGVSKIEKGMLQKYLPEKC